MTPDRLNAMSAYLGMVGRSQLAGLDLGDLKRIQAQLDRSGLTTLLKNHIKGKNGENAKKAEILDGGDSECLKENIHTYTLRSGDFVAAATDRGIDRERNEDRMVVDPLSSSVVAIDGLGGGDNGDLAAQILAEAFEFSKGNPKKAIKECIRVMQELIAKRLLTRFDGACFASVRISEDYETDNKTANIKIVGDAKVMIFGKKGPRFISKEQSQIQDLLNSGVLTEDQALYFIFRNIISNCVNGRGDTKNPLSDEIYIEEGDIILVMSDGISSNLTPDEIWELIQEYRNDPKKIIEILSDVTDARMKNSKRIINDTPDRIYDGEYMDGYKSKPSPDNRALAVIRVG